ncbi:hypothetical protein [Bacillus paranthracis]|uniref:hypothetical protein n=1 Tax=Bacillus paranthracis TaxID=2026186 RepID=UPI0022E4BFF7|nr:hypothetical protein [Bacillus paranthracis]
MLYQTLEKLSGCIGLVHFIQGAQCFDKVTKKVDTLVPINKDIADVLGSMTPEGAAELQPGVAKVTHMLMTDDENEDDYLIIIGVGEDNFFQLMGIDAQTELAKPLEGDALEKPARVLVGILTEFAKNAREDKEGLLKAAQNLPPNINAMFTGLVEAAAEIAANMEDDE